MPYSPKVIDHYENPRNVGSLDGKADNVGTGLVGAPSCGDVMKLQIQVDDSGVITDVKFKTFGCGSAIAASSYGSELLPGKNISSALEIKNTHIAEALSLPPVKIHCSILMESAIRAAVKDYQTKQAIKKEKEKTEEEESTVISCKDIKSEESEINKEGLALKSYNEYKEAGYLKVTQLAEQVMKEKIKAENPNAVGYKLWVSKGGCSGQRYNMQYAEYGKNIYEVDHALTLGDIKIFVDPKSVMFLIGMTIDYVKTDFSEEFKFINPNEKNTCGCGESFAV